jgi:carboxymethylenebutenolidase
MNKETMMHTEQITFPANGGTGQGYLAAPDEPGPHRAVVVIQEWWGLNEHIMDVTRRFAQAGYLALAPDLYHGATTDEPDEARKLVMQMQLPQAVAEMAGAAAYLTGREDVQPKKVGVVGFCVGGSLALMLAAHSPDIGAVASFYGGREVPEDELRKISAPVLAIFGAEDQSISPERHDALRRLFTATGLRHEVHVYPFAPHAFFNDTRPQVYHREAAHDAWGRTLGWFAANLGNKT